MVEPVIDILLTSKEPSIRWKTRVHVLGESPASRAVKGLESEICDSPRVQALLARRDARGRLAHRRHSWPRWPTSGTRGAIARSCPCATRSWSTG